MGCVVDSTTNGLQWTPQWISQWTPQWSAQRALLHAGRTQRAIVSPDRTMNEASALDILRYL
eukprot:4383360-Lingulodinium_polyedra.AAC.1